MSAPTSAEVVVIGSGICGSLAAWKLATRGVPVLILEAGPRIDRGRIVAAFRNSPRKSDWMAPYPLSPWAPQPQYKPKDNGYLVQAGPYPYPAEYIRVVGGTTWHWAAQAWRLVPNDVRIKTLYGVGVDWPMTYEELDPWYQEAEEILGVAGAPDTGSPRKHPFPMPPVADPWSMRRFRERLAPAYPWLPTRWRATVAATAGAPPAWATTVASRSARSTRSTSASMRWSRRKPRA